MKAAGYVRVSTERQKENESHVRQRERLEDWAGAEGYDLELFEDIAISGQDDNREDYQELMDRAEEFDVVVVRELSRFGRSLQKVCADIEELHDRGVDFVSLKEDLDMTSAQGKLMLHIIAAFNQFWADWSRERAMEYVEQQREAGEPVGRPRKVSDDEYERIQELRREGHSLKQIKILVENMEEFDVDSIDKSTIHRYCEGVEISSD